MRCHIYAKGFEPDNNNADFQAAENGSAHFIGMYSSLVFLKNVFMLPAFKDDDANNTPITNDDGHMKIPRTNGFLASKGYGSVGNIFSDGNPDRKPANIGTTAINDRGFQTAEQVGDNSVKRKKFYLWCKLSTILLACIIILTSAVLLRHYLQQLH